MLNAHANTLGRSEVIYIFITQLQLCFCTVAEYSPQLVKVTNVEAIQLLDNSRAVRRLKRLKPFELV
jgi:hypothetical protein